jgi:hypothetical protein
MGIVLYKDATPTAFGACGAAVASPPRAQHIGAAIAPDVLRHRIILTCEAGAQAVTTDATIKKIFNAVPVP